MTIFMVGYRTVSTANPTVAVYFKGEWVYLATRNFTEHMVIDGQPRPWVFELLDEDDNVIAVTGPTIQSFEPDKMPDRTILPTSLSPREQRALCRTHNIPESWVVTSDERASKQPQKDRIRQSDKKRMDTPLTQNQFKDFRNKLKEPHRLVADILWNVNRDLKGYSFFTLEEVLYLQWWDVTFCQKTRLVSVVFHSPQVQNRASRKHWTLPRSLGDRMRKELRVSNSPFLFHSRSGGPLCPEQVGRNFSKALEEVGISGSGSMVLRPILRDDGYLRLLETENTSSSSLALYLIPKAKWMKATAKVEEIGHARGRKPLHEPRTLASAIFYKIAHDIPWRDLPEGYPPWSAVEGQYRRWQKKGVWDELARLLTSA
ncbi:MAG: transposase [Chlamydiia bacterium]|nr:transposase [Chlamydiia bacterium]